MKTYISPFNFSFDIPSTHSSGKHTKENMASFYEEVNKYLEGLECEIDTTYMELKIYVENTYNSKINNNPDVYILPFRGWIHGKASFPPSFADFVIDNVPPSKQTTKEILNNVSLLLQKLNYEYCCLKNI